MSQSALWSRLYRYVMTLASTDESESLPPLFIRCPQVGEDEISLAPQHDDEERHFLDAATTVAVNDGNDRWSLFVSCFNDQGQELKWWRYGGISRARFAAGHLCPWPHLFGKARLDLTYKSFQSMPLS